MVDKDVLANLLLEFEEEHHKEISNFMYGDLCVWPYVKVNCYFKLIRVSEATVPPQKRMVRALKKLKFIVHNGINLIYSSYFVFLVTLKPKSKNGIAFFTYSVDKHLKNEKGEFYNHLVDGFIVNDLVKDFWYIEKSSEQDCVKPGAVPVDLKLSKLLSLGTLYRKRYNKDIRIRELTQSLTAVLHTFFRKKHLNIELEQAYVKGLLAGLISDYKVYNLLLRKLKPKLIICSEQPGSPLLAVANKLKIRSIDLQHGIINNTHPQYVYSSELGNIKLRMALPSSIGVFGEMHKEILLEKGFWNSQEIVILGSSIIDINRQKYNVTLDKWNCDDKTILIPTQWTVFNDLMTLLNVLVRMESINFTIIVKIHPLEPALNIKEYQRMAELFPGKIRFAGKDVGIYELIKNAFFVVGFDTAVLLESVALGVPSITITTRTAPYGIHGMLSSDELESVILPVSIDDLPSIMKVLSKAINNESYYNNWTLEAKEKGGYLFAKDYVRNCSRYIAREMAN